MLGELVEPDVDVVDSDIWLLVAWKLDAAGSWLVLLEQAAKSKAAARLREARMIFVCFIKDSFPFPLLYKKIAGLVNFFAQLKGDFGPLRQSAESR